MRTVNTEQQDKENIFNSADTSFNYAEHSHIKPPQKVLENKERHRICVKIFFFKKKGISSSKGNTKGLYKFIFHITID